VKYSTGISIWKMLHTRSDLSKNSTESQMQHRAQRQVFLSPHGATAPRGPGPPHYRGFTTTPRHTTLGMTPLGTRSVRCREIHLTRHNTHTRQTSMPPRGVRTRIPSKRAAAHPRLRPRGHWDRPSIFMLLHDLQVYLLKKMQKKPVAYRHKNKHSCIL
jgi:hypothetical protein